MPVVTRVAGEERTRHDGERTRDDEPREPPARLAREPDQRHPDDPGERRSEQRDRQHARTLVRRRPFGRRSDRRRVRDADADTVIPWASASTAKSGAAALSERAASENDDGTEKQPAQTDSRREQTHEERRETRREARDRSELAGGRDRHVEVAGDVRQEGVEDDERGLRRRERRQQRAADDSRPVAHQRMIGTVPPSALHAAPVT